MEFIIKRKRVTIHFSFLLLLCLFLIAEEGEGWAIVMVLSIALHEGAHCMAMALCRAPIEAVRFSAYGIELRRKLGCTSEWQDIFICAAGPGANFLAALLCNIFAKEGELLSAVVAVNLVIGLFNCAPIFPLDGGQILLLLSQHFFSQRAAMVITATAGGILLSVSIGGALFLFCRTKQASLLLFCILAALQLWNSTK